MVSWRTTFMMPIIIKGITVQQFAQDIGYNTALVLSSLVKGTPRDWTCAT